ncbi:DUF6479 family protein [Streptomyces sp. NPDC090036]|uniref:DUF6479 family protein n=1 Tax=Streptomyces sp. NPDC090036 TaxID=3365926 RepID=UPI003810AA16
MTAIETLAAEGQASLFLIFAGVVLVILLIGAFWYGSRRRRREVPPTEQNPVAQSRADGESPSPVKAGVLDGPGGAGLIGEEDRHRRWVSPARLRSHDVQPLRPIARPTT